MTGVAVKVVLLPAQIVNDGVLILTDGVTDGLLVIANILLVAVDVPAQIALLIITKDTTSLLARADVVNAVLLVPAFNPFICH